MPAISRDYTNWTKYKALTDTQKKIVIENMPLVHEVYKNHISIKIKRSRFKSEDLIQVGAVVLMRCVQQFNNELGYKFSTYAYNSIKNKMLNFVMRYSKSYIVPVNFKLSDYDKLPPEVSADAFSFGDLYGSYFDNSYLAVEFFNDFCLEHDYTKTYDKKYNYPEILEMYIQGFTATDIGKQIGVVPSTAASIVNSIKEYINNYVKN